MALSNFLFYGNGFDTHANKDRGPRTAQWQQGIANSGSGTDNDIGGRGAAGAAITNSTLSNPLPSGIASTYCRGYMWGKAQGDNQYLMGAGASAYLNSSSGGSKYPTNNLGESDAYSYSCRAFLRVERESGGATAQGSGCNIGLFHKAWHTDGSTQYLGQSATHGGQTNGQGYSFPHGGIVNGYQVLLSGQTTWVHDGTSNHGNGGNSMGCNSAPRLIIVAPEVESDDIIDNSSTGGDSTACSGTYAFATWYHVRMDVYPDGGNDVIKVYTAPISGAGSADTEEIGNETWTLVGTHTVYGASDSYVTWNDAQRRYSGYWCSSAKNSNNDDTWNAYIDRFQFLTKDIS